MGNEAPGSPGNPTSAGLVREDFPGAVILTEWMSRPDPRNAIAVAGIVSVLTDEELLGFKVNSNDSRWGCRVVGPSGFAVVIPGCKVRQVLVFTPGFEVTNTEYWVLP